MSEHRDASPLSFSNARRLLLIVVWLEGRRRVDYTALTADADRIVRGQADRAARR